MRLINLINACVAGVLRAHAAAAGRASAGAVTKGMVTKGASTGVLSITVAVLTDSEVLRASPAPIIHQIGLQATSGFETCFAIHTVYVL